MPTIYEADESQSKEEKNKKKDITQKSFSDGPREKKKARLRQIANGVKPKAGLSITPPKIEFVNKRPEEEVLLVLRRHHISNISWLAIFIFMMAVLVCLVRLGWLDFLPAGLGAPFVYLWLVVALSVLWAGLVDWFFNVNIVSDERVVDIDFFNLIYREVTDAEIEKIQDVTHNMGGLFGLLFNYGDVYVQTASANPEIEFLNVPEPARVASVLRKIREEIQENDA